MKQRLGIAAALLGDPQLLILDEPINGLDPAGVHEMRGLIGRLAGGERTVLVSSHVLSELEQVCDWLIVIDGGQLVFQGPAAELLDRVGREPRRRSRAPRRPRPLAAPCSSRPATTAGPPKTGWRSLWTALDPRGLAAAVNRTAGAGGIVLAELRIARRQPRGPLPHDGERTNG